MAGSKKKRFQITTTLPGQLVTSVERMAKQNGMTKSAIVEKLCWLGHSALASNSCLDDIEQLRLGLAEVEREGGAVNSDLVEHSDEVITESLDILSKMPPRGRAPLHGLLKVLIDLNGQAQKLNEKRWVAENVEGAVESAEKIQ